MLPTSETQTLYSVGPACTDLKTQNQVPQFALNHAEADTMMFTAYSLIRETFPNLDIVMDTADTDNYVQAAFISHQLQGNLFIKHKDGYINSYDLLDDDTSEVVIPAHIFGGGDHTKSFYGKGKIKYMDRIINDEEARELLSDVGSDPDLDSDVKYDMEQFLLTKIYGCSPGLSCGEARAEKWRKQKNKNTLNLPPDSDSPSESKLFDLHYEEFPPQRAPHTNRKRLGACQWFNLGCSV